MAPKGKSPTYNHRKRIAQDPHKNKDRQHGLAQTNAAILNALPAPIVIVDSQGVIRSVNEAWKDFARTDNFGGNGFGIGDSYLEICEQAHGEYAEEAKIVAEGLRGVLTGARKTFTWKYRCHSSNQSIWFQAMITPISEKGAAGAVIMHIQSTDHREREAQFRLYKEIIKNEDEAIAIMDLQWRYVEQNSAHSRLLGYSKDELSGKTPAIHLGESTFSQIAEELEKTRSYNGEIICLTKSGAALTIDLTAYAVSDHTGEPAYFVEISRDITDRKKAEQVRALSHKVFETSPDHISIVGCDYRYRQINHAYEVAHSLSRQKIVGLHIADLLGKKVFRKIIKPNFDRALSGEIVTYESWFGFPSMGHRYMTVTYSPLQSGAKEIDAVVVVARDLTDGKLAEDALNTEQQFIANVLDTTGALIMTLDPKWRIVRINRACEELTGRTTTEMKGNSFLDLAVASGEDGPGVRKLFTSLQEGNLPKSFENGWVDRDRKLRWISWSNTAITDKQGHTEYIIATGIDITERKQAEEALQEK